MAATEAKRQASRWPALLDAAAARFAEQGYHATTIRELAAATDMTPGAIYFHVLNKQALLLAVYQEGVQRIVDHVERATDRSRDPWERLACRCRSAPRSDPRRQRLCSRRHPHPARRRPGDRWRTHAPARPLRTAVSRADRAGDNCQKRHAEARPAVSARRAQLDAGLVSTGRGVHSRNRARGASPLCKPPPGSSRDEPDASRPARPRPRHQDRSRRPRSRQPDRGGLPARRGHGRHLHAALAIDPRRREARRSKRTSTRSASVRSPPTTSSCRNSSRRCARRDLAIRRRRRRIVPTTSARALTASGSAPFRPRRLARRIVDHVAALAAQARAARDAELREWTS